MAGATVRVHAGGYVPGSAHLYDEPNQPERLALSVLVILKAARGAEGAEGSPFFHRLRVPRAALLPEDTPYPCRRVGPLQGWSGRPGSRGAAGGDHTHLG